MGIYLNPRSERFQTSLRSQIYVDKTMLIEKVNRLVRTEQKYVCVSRPRRFGKSMAADMLSAYYGRHDTAQLFEHLKIADADSYREHLNKYDVIKINMQEFLSVTNSVEEMLSRLKDYVSFDLLDEYENVRYRDKKNFIQVMKDIHASTKR